MHASTWTTGVAAPMKRAIILHGNAAGVGRPDGRTHTTPSTIKFSWRLTRPAWLLKLAHCAAGLPLYVHYHLGGSLLRPGRCFRTVLLALGTVVTGEGLLL